ncbi:MAG: aldo/keto reductase [Candidatus Rokuibacteriota bacterium]|nr:MAG: aldo/keto reductase [Candidatus Rokubacteria bacterium]
MSTREGELVIKGFATARGTSAYCARHVPPAERAHFRSWDGLEISSVGIGTYLGSEDAGTDRAYRDAIARALELGLNVVDSAVNYRHQKSERVIGAALRTLIDGGQLARDEVVIATKGGFIPFDGSVPVDHDAYVTETYVRPGILEPKDLVGKCHCVTPRYLADQLERSRRNLDVETIDIYYVHNPERQLAEVDRPTFLGRMRAAFQFLEEAVGDGKIRRYGTATWNAYRQQPSDREFLSLPDLARLASEVAGSGHHFRVIQLPYNLGLTEAFTRANQVMGDEAVSLLEAARRLDMYVMTSASLHQGQLARNLPPIIGEFLPGLATDAQRALQFVRSTPGVGTALVGMKQRGHVEENARLTAVAPLAWEQFKTLFSEG